MKKIFITIITVIHFVLIYGQDFKTYTRNEISFEYPSDWVIHNIPNFYVLVSEPPSKQISFLTNFDVSVEKYCNRLAKYGKEYEQKISDGEIFKEFAIKSKKKINFNGLKALEYRCTAKMKNFPVEWKAILFTFEKKAYKLSTTSPISEFKDFEKTAERIFSSFKLDKNYKKSYDYAIAVLDKAGLSCSYHFKYFAPADIILKQSETDSINNFLREKIREKGAKRTLVQLINEVDEIEQTIKNDVRKNFNVEHLEVSYIGIRDFLQEYLIQKNVNLEGVKIIDFDYVDY